MKLNISFQNLKWSSSVKCICTLSPLNTGELAERSCYQGPAFCCDKIVVIVTLVRCIAGSVGLMFAILRILRKARGNGGYSMFRETYLRATTYEWTFYRESKRTYIKTIFTLEQVFRNYNIFSQKNICDKIDFHIARQTWWCKQPLCMLV